MPPVSCVHCGVLPAAMKRPQTGAALCRGCFYAALESDAHRTIVANALFTPGEVVACGASGGKDSTVMMHLLTTLNARHGYGVRFVLVSVDEGIAGYRDESLVTVRRNAQQYALPLTIVSYEDLYGGWSMDRIVAQIGSKSNCTYCGVFRRHALEFGARMAGATKIATGHNADDTAETVLMNLLRSDIPRLERCTSAQTNEAADDDAPLDHGGGGGGGASASIPRVKPMRDLYEKEIVLYAHFKQLDYFSTECTYSKEAFRGNARTLVKALEAVSPRSIASIVASGGAMFVDQSRRLAEYVAAGAAAAADNESGASSGASAAVAVRAPVPAPARRDREEDAVSVRSVAPSAASARGQVAQRCGRCGSLTSRSLCRACVLVDSLNGTGPRVAVGVVGAR